MPAHIRIKVVAVTVRGLSEQAMVPGIGLVKCQVKLITCSGAVTADGSVGEAPDEPDERD